MIGVQGINKRETTRANCTRYFKISSMDFYLEFISLFDVLLAVEMFSMVLSP